MKEKIQKRLAEIRARLAELRARMNEITDKALEESRDLNAEEATDYREARDERTGLKAEEDRLQAELRDLEAEEGDPPPSSSSSEEEPPPGDELDDEDRRQNARNRARRGSLAVNREPLTYERHDVRSSYFHDLFVTSSIAGAGSMGDPGEARARLQRHAEEMRVEVPRLEQRRAGTVDNPRVRYADPEDEARERRTGRAQAIQYERRDLDRVDGSGGEFVPPLWMMEDFISLARGGRVIADACRQIPLPTGTDSINLPKVSGGAATAPQTADNAAVSETDITTTSVSAAVRTNAGQQDVALQLLEQSPLAFDQVIFEDLVDDHAVRIDVQVINGSAASGQVRGILQIASVDTTTYTDATPTLPELWPKVADSMNQVASSRLRRATAVFMHTRRWYWSNSQLDSSNRPFIVPNAQGPQNALMAFQDADTEGPVGNIMGATIFADPNVPTNLGAGTDEDRIIVTRPNELYLFEGAVRTRVLPEVGSGTLTVRFQLYNYFTFMPDRRAESTSIVAGTGLVAPVF